MDTGMLFSSAASLLSLQCAVLLYDELLKNIGRVMLAETQQLSGTLSSHCGQPDSPGKLHKPRMKAPQCFSSAVDILRYTAAEHGGSLQSS